MISLKLRKRFYVSVIILFPIIFSISSCNTNLRKTTSPIFTNPLIISSTSSKIKTITQIPQTLTSIPTLTSTKISTLINASQENNWMPLGPEGGNFEIVTINPSIHTTIYAGSGSFLYKSIDGGGHWSKINSGLSIDREIMAIAINPLIPTTIFLVDSPGLWTPGKLYKTTDGGEKWYLIQLSEVNTVIIDQMTPSIIYAGCYDGVYKSIDGGESWNRLGLILNVHTLILDPNIESIIYAGIENGSVFKSIDSGDSWTQIKDEGIEQTGFIVIDIHPKITNSIYVGTYDGIFKSTNGGKDWKQLAKVNSSNVNVFNGILAIIIDPNIDNAIYVASLHGIYKSTDGGINWDLLENNLLFPDIYYLVMDKKEPNILYAASHGGGIYKTKDSGTNWYTTNNELIGENLVNNIAIDPDATNTIYASTRCGLYKSRKDGNDWSLISLHKGGIITIDPRKTTTIYQTGWEDIYYRANWSILFKSMNGGGRWTSGYHVAFGSRITALVIDPKETNILYAGTWGEIETSGIYKSIDGGATWKKTGLSAIRALSIDPNNNSILYAATLAEGIYKSIDGGENWKLINKHNYEIRTIVIDPITSTTIYIGNQKSTDGGESWEKMGGGGPILAIDPLSPNIIYTGGEFGVLKSIDSGKNWFSIGLENKLIYTIAIDTNNTNKLYVGTGTGVYFLNQE